MHLFKMRLLCLLRDKTLIFWTLLFPLMMSLFFFLAFSNIDNGEIFNTIKVGVIQNETPEGFIQVLESVEYDNDKLMFSVTETTLDDAKILLTQGKVTGYIEYIDNQFYLTIRSSGLNETIIKTFMDQYVQNTASFMTIKSLTNISDQQLMQELAQYEEYLTERENGTKSPDAILNYFYSLIGMALIYGGFWGSNEIINLQANLSTKGMRVSIGPTKRLKLLLTNMGCAFLIHFLEMMFFLFFINVVLGVTMGSNLPLVILFCVLGSITGISFGAFTSIALKKASEGIKVAITSLTGVLGGFLSGMMYANMKYIIQTNAPILAYINPVNVITDGLFSLYYFDNLNRYFMNLIILIVMSCIFISGTYLFFRRDNYESI